MEEIIFHNMDMERLSLKVTPSWQLIGCDKKENELFVDMFDEDFEKYLGLSKPESIQKQIAIWEQEECVEGDKYWVIYQREIPVGVVFLYNNKPKYEKTSFAIGVKNTYRRLGISKAVISALIDQLVKQNYCRITAEIAVTNRPSLWLTKYLMDIGFRLEGVLRSNMGKNVDCMILGYVV